MNNNINKMNNNINKMNTINIRKNSLKAILIVLTLVITMFLALGFRSRVSANIFDGNTSILNSNNNIENREVDKQREQPTYTSTTVESVTSGMSDETLSFTNLLLIVLISINIVLLLLAIIILMQINKKI